MRGVATVTFAPGLHGYQNPPSQDYMIPVTLASRTEGVPLRSVTYPRGVVKMAGGEEAAVYSGTIQIRFEFTAPSTPGEKELVLDLGYQQCTDENCYPPENARTTLKYEVVAPAAPPPVERPTETRPPVEPPAERGERTESTPPAADPDPETEDPDATASEVESEPGFTITDTPAPSDEEVDTPGEAVSTVPPSDSGQGLAGRFGDAIAGGNYVLIFGLLFVIGLLVNLTPCVYPLIPITIGFFARQAAGNRAVRLQLGMMYMLGIAVMYGTVGGVASAAGMGFGALFTNMWFNIFLGLVMIGLALSMFGLYEIGIPAPLQKHLGGRSGAVGALMMGLLVGVGAAPCAGPAIAAVAVKAAETQNILLGTAMFTSIGLGIGLPYLALAASSAGIESLPKAGGWMILVKAVLGLAVIGVGLNYLLQAFYLERHIVTLIWVAFFIGSAVYLLAFDKSDVSKRFAAILKGSAILLFGILGGVSYQQYQHILYENELVRLGVTSGIDWVKWEEDTYAEALASGRPIFIDATANWCAECRVIEANIFNTPRGIHALNQVVAMKIDHSSYVDPEYIQRTREKFDIYALPHFIIMKPGGEVLEVRKTLHSIDELEDLLRRAGANL